MKPRLKAYPTHRMACDALRSDLGPWDRADLPNMRLEHEDGTVTVYLPLGSESDRMRIAAYEFSSVWAHYDCPPALVDYARTRVR